MKIIFTDLTAKEFFEYGGIVTVEDGQVFSTFNAWWNYDMSIDDDPIVVRAELMGNRYIYDDSEFKYSDYRNFLEPKDPYGIPNVNFTLIEPDDDRWEKYKEERLKYGYDSSELWNLNTTIAQFILPRLRDFRDYHAGYPTCYDSEQEWEEILDKMIWSFEAYLRDDWNEQKKPEYMEGLRIFSENFNSLWC